MIADSPWDDFTTVLQRAEQARSGKDIALAYAFFTRATEIDSNNAQAWAGRAALTPDLDDSIISWAYAVALAPDNASAKDNLAMRVDEKIAGSRIADLASLVTLGKNLAEVGQKREAYQLFKRATELDDTSEEAWIWRAGLAEDAKETTESLNQVLTLNPQNKQAQAGLQWATSLQPGLAVSAPPNNAEQAANLVEQGNAALQKGDKAKAHDLFQQATELDQKNEQAWLWRGSTTSDVDEALTCMEQALAINPANEPAREARSWLRVKKLRETAKTQPDTAPQTLDRSAKTKPQRNVLIVLAIVIILVLVTLIYLRLRGII